MHTDTLRTQYGGRTAFTSFGLWFRGPGETAGSSAAYGTVGYAHAGGIDRPLSITKDGVTVIPHQNWRGQFSRGTYASGSDCPPGVTSGCTPIPWPGYRTTVWHVGKKELDIRNWYGGLVDGMRDASGQMYMRNRYYDPATGQFTQTDPIGLAGGLNAYGFAAGDPVTYSDPYGLCPFPPTDCPPGYFTVRLTAAGAGAGAALGAGAGLVAAAPTGELASPLTVVAGAAGGSWAGGKTGAFIGSAIDVGVQVANSELASRAGEQFRKWSAVIISALTFQSGNQDGPEPPPRPTAPPPPPPSAQSSGTGPRPNPDPKGFRFLP